MWIRRIAYLGLMVLCLAYAVTRVWQPVAAPRLLLALHPDPQGPQSVPIWGEVVSLTRRGPRSLRFVLRVQGRWPNASHSAGDPLSEPVRVWVSWPLTPEAQHTWSIQPGDQLLLSLRWRQTSPAREGAFDTWRWLQQQDLKGMATVVDDPEQPARRLSQNKATLQGWRQSVRDRIFEVVRQPRQAGLVAALSMGDQSAIETEDWDIFRRTGVAHLVSISGMHVTLLALWLAALVDAVWRKLSWRGRSPALWWPAPMLAQWVALFAACLYALFSGWGLPAQRTVWMLMATQAWMLLGLRWPAHATWLGLIALVGVLDPLAYTQPGFWLSYVAVGVLFAFQQPTRQTSAWRRWWTETVDMQWRITLALMPLTVWFFEGVSLAGLWVNLWAIPWVTLVVTPLSLLGMVCPPLWVLAGWASGWLLWALEWSAQTPWALIEIHRPPAWTLIPATAAAVRAVLPGSAGWRWTCAGLATALLVNPWPRG